MRIVAGAAILALSFDVATAFSAPPLAAARLAYRSPLAQRSVHRRSENARSHGALALQGTVAVPVKQAQKAQWGPDAGQDVSQWRRNLDLKAWADKVRQVERKYRGGQGEQDVKHLNKILNFSYFLYAVGLLTAGWAVFPWNPISAICLSTSICARWTMVGHHVSHGGYNAQVGTEGRFHRKHFAKGPVRRFIDWCDWMQPEAWDVEHNYMHHYMLGEGRDPDLLERNAHHIRNGKHPLWLKFVDVAILACMWKWYYYAPNTLKEQYAYEAELETNKHPTRASKQTEPILFDTGLQPGGFGDVTRPATFRYVWREALKSNFKPLAKMSKVLGPYFSAHFVLTPAVFYALFGPAVAATALANLVAAEVLTNIHSFAIVVPNHAGEDLYRFETPVKVKSDEFYLRAVIGSANFNTGSDANDFMHGWLNYQIEHHMFPDLSMLSYQRMAPEIKAICEEHGVPYVQENVFLRVWRTTQIGVGSRSMLVWEKGH